MKKKKSDFYTLKGYDLKNKSPISFAMEDYLEMMYRMMIEEKKTTIHVKELGELLNVSAPSVSKMVARLKDAGYIMMEPYKTIYLSKKGLTFGRYLLKRHNLLLHFFQALNPTKNFLEQVEKIEHFMEKDTLKEMEQWLKKEKEASNSLLISPILEESQSDNGHFLI